MSEMRYYNNSRIEEAPAGETDVQSCRLRLEKGNRYSMGFRFEFDSVNKILLLRFEGRLTDELLTELYWTVRRYSTATDASAGIWDLSPVTEFAVSPECIRDMANREPAMPDATRRPRFIVAPPFYTF